MKSLFRYSFKGKHTGISVLNVRGTVLKKEISYIIYLCAVWIHLVYTHVYEYICICTFRER